jgi:RNA polymerase sigma-70 factor (ECF subfamily)
MAGFFLLSELPHTSVPLYNRCILLNPTAMSSDKTTAELQSLINRMNEGDASVRESLRNELIGRAYERLRGLAKKILHEDFPRLRTLHDTGSILDEAAGRLLKSLHEVPLVSVHDFLGFAAEQIRRVLLDMARKKKQPRPLSPMEGSGSRNELTDNTNDPVKLAQWEEFHRAVEKLPEEERSVFKLCWYGDLNRTAAAAVLGIHERTARRLWISAIRRVIELVRV